MLNIFIGTTNRVEVLPQSNGRSRRFAFFFIHQKQDIAKAADVSESEVKDIAQKITNSTETVTRERGEWSNGKKEMEFSLIDRVWGESYYRIKIRGWSHKLKGEAERLREESTKETQYASDLEEAINNYIDHQIAVYKKDNSEYVIWDSEIIKVLVEEGENRAVVSKKIKEIALRRTRKEVLAAYPKRKFGAHGTITYQGRSGSRGIDLRKLVIPEEIKPKKATKRKTNVFKLRPKKKTG